jgi:phenylpyruvate tautomerase PptA (4-oxalocrotonate tautomerase family)
MPIIDVEIVIAPRAALPAGLAQALADAAGRMLDAPAGRVWVRLRTLDATQYAENGEPHEPDGLPVFVTVLHARMPAMPELAAEARSLGTAIAACVGTRPDRVHVEYAPPGSGRIAFGGTLVS